MAFLGLISWSLFVDACRLLSICMFLLCSLTFNWYSFLSIIFMLVSLYLLDRNRFSEKPRETFPGSNPYKWKRRVKDEDKIPANVRAKFTDDILDLVLYDVKNCQALRDFEPVQMNTHCIFAKKAVLWGAYDYDRDLSVEQNVVRSLPALVKFMAVGTSLHLDGFLFELPGDEFGQTPQKFGEGVRRILKCISDHDPAGFHCMNKSYVSKIGWSFEFNREPIFVTTFAPCYPENHSRYAFGAEGAFILLQPMYSFAIHDIGDDTPHTNWDNPITVRDKIRVAYKENNRPYYIRNTVIYPAAHDVVKPLREGVGELVEWWKDPAKPEEGRGEGSDDEVFGATDTEEDSEDSESRGEDAENQCPVLGGGEECPNPADKKTQ